MRRGAVLAVVLAAEWIAAACAGAGVAARPDAAGDAPAAGGPRLGVVRVREAVGAAGRASLGRAGVRLIEYRGEGAWLAELPAAPSEAVARHPLVAGVRPLLPRERLAPDLLTREAAPGRARELERLGLRAFVVHLAPGAGAEGVLAALAEEPGAAAWGVLGEDRLEVHAAAPRAGMARLAEALGGLGEVLWIEPAPGWAPRDETQRWIVQDNRPGEHTLLARGLNGSGQVLGLLDSEVFKDHCAFIDPYLRPPGPEHRKILAYNAPYGSSEHGTHVAAIAVGDGHQGETDGIAPAARVVYNRPPAFADATLLERLRLHAAQGARVHSNSWGNDASRAYDAMVRAIDQFCWEDDANLVVVAVSNGAAVTTPENAKSALAVGASHDAPEQHRWFGGGAGPTLDGRRKPEVLAPGGGIVSAWGLNCFTKPMSGTSTAAPAVAGAALLARQYFAQGWHPSGTPRPEDAFEPSGQLLRAVVVNSAEDLSGEAGWPTPREGFGRVRLDEALWFPGEARRLAVVDVRNRSEKSLAAGEERRYELAVHEDAAAGALEITMAYADAPGALGAAPATVNDLDLVVEAPSGRVYYGNAIDAWSGASVDAGSGGRRDPLNTLEAVRIASPEPGLWRVRVEGRGVHVPGQGFALAATGPVGAFAEPAPCAADLDGDGAASVADLLAFLGAFRAADGRADIDASGGVDVNDLLAYLGAFRAGCG